MQLINIRKVKEILNYKNCYSAIRWCKNNGVKIFCHNGTNRKFVSAEQFEWIRFGQYLQGVNVQSNYLKDRIEIVESWKNNIENLYHEQRYMSRLQKKIREL